MTINIREGNLIFYPAIQNIRVEHSTESVSEPIIKVFFNNIGLRRFVWFSEYLNKQRGMPIVSLNELNEALCEIGIMMEIPCFPAHSFATAFKIETLLNHQVIAIDAKVLAGFVLQVYGGEFYETFTKTQSCPLQIDSIEPCNLDLFDPAALKLNAQVNLAKYC